ncbi:O-methyltransferase [Marinobacterium lutimaris]|uniref:Predicted O-methyltransferase YrrM n=1 Tax=Marinobacterium lutimaris TaxID=568106 RepID=A0A1H5TLM7_9GAMM|nr:class I SAM-dependent methyltransferase [Marinobacterium lutimaris]SEF63762.1 Predicted O-methyltransferase YrrM [Marinobacterium lutimaris]
MTTSYSLNNDSQAAKVLNELYAEAEKQRSGAGNRLTAEAGAVLTPLERFTALKHRYMPIDRPFGNLMYSLLRASQAKTIVEFGTSFGISTIFLAAAARDNGFGKVITTEFIAEKAERARENLTRAGLVDWVEFRVGDALQTLSDPLPGPVDFLFLDGEKSLYLDMVRRVEPQMATGCLIASDNTDHQGAEPYLQYMRDPQQGYVSTPILTQGGPKAHSGHEISFRL